MSTLKSLGNGLFIDDHVTPTWANLGIRIIDGHWTLSANVTHEDLFTSLDWKALATYAEDNRSRAMKRLNEIDARLNGSASWSDSYRNALQIEKELLQKEEKMYAHMRDAFSKLDEVFGEDMPMCRGLRSSLREAEYR